MSPIHPGRPRVVVYVFASPYLRGAAEDVLRARLVELCSKAGINLVEIVVDHGPPKRRASEYPTLARVARGEADGVMVMRSALFKRGRAVDRLELLCPEESPGWLPADVLKAAGMLPKRRKVVPQAKRPVRRRAAELRSAGLSLRQVVQVLEAEGYRRRGGMPWNQETVEALLGVPSMEEGRCEERRWSLEGPAAWQLPAAADG